MTDWPLIPPQYRGWTFHGSPFPAYYDDEFAEFREYGGRVRRETEQGDRCEVHGRFLSKQEHAAGRCFWCHPKREQGSRRGLAWSMQSGKAAEEPSESDDPEAMQDSFL